MRQSKLQSCPAKMYELMSNTPQCQRLSKLNTPNGPKVRPVTGGGKLPGGATPGGTLPGGATPGGALPGGAIPVPLGGNTRNPGVPEFAAKQASGGWRWGAKFDTPGGGATKSSKLLRNCGSLHFLCFCASPWHKIRSRSGPIMNQNHDLVCPNPISGVCGWIWKARVPFAIQLST